MTNSEMYAPTWSDRIGLNSRHVETRLGGVQHEAWTASTAVSMQSWNAGGAGRAIQEFVARVTSMNGPDYLPKSARIAAFDDDGTLWPELPIPAHIQCALDGLSTQARQSPELKPLPMYKAAVNGDLAWFAPYLQDDRLPELAQALREAAEGETQRAFEARVSSWLNTAKHPRFGRPYQDLAFVPMVELLGFLQSKGFKVFIVSSGSDFVRMVSEEVLKIPSSHIIRGGRSVGRRRQSLGRSLQMQMRVRRQPILVCGNGDGDLEMMELAAAGGKPWLNLVLKHDDADREYESSANAKLIQRTAKERGWTTISMAADFRTVFSD